ncbi:MAG TPA: TonB-dependent receptor [Bacteroidia bacterium]|nr:TonB-dependent receptor [Bacteroidia bacterium]
MKSIFTLLLAILSLSGIYAQTGTISGKVSTSDGQAGEFVIIGLKGTTIGTTANDSGNFVLNNLKPGTYTLIASFTGLEAKEQTVVVINGQTTVVNFVMNESSSVLKEVVIRAQRSVNERPVSIGKVPISPMDLPQSTSVINSAQMNQQQVLHMSDVLRNTNGVYQMGASGGYQEEIAGRGFAYGSSNTFKNGIRFNNAAMPEVSALERVEVLKGGNAILFGNVAAGGVLNIVTKKPVFEKGGEVTMRVGSYGLYKPTIDIYGPMNAKRTVGFRLNTTYEKAASFRESVYSNRFYVNPSFLWKVGPKTEILIEGDYLKDQRTLDNGVGAINYQLIDVPRTRFLGTSWQYFKSEQQYVAATVTHNFNSQWTLRSTTGISDFSSDLFGTTRPNANNNFVQADGTWKRGIQRTQVDEQYYITQLDLIGKFATGPVKHTLLVGADADKYDTRTLAYATITSYDTINVFDPEMYTQREDIPQLNKNTLTTAPVLRAGFYVQDLVEISQKLKVLVGARVSYIETYSDVYSYSTGNTTHSVLYDHAISPRFGIVYQPVKTVSVFTSYTNSFTPNTGVDINGNALAPSVIDQYEAGIKTDLFHGLLSANAVVYQITNSNLAQTSLENGNTNSNIKEMTGEVTSRGIEVDIMSKDWNGFSLIAGYSFNETRYTKSNTYIVGSKLRYNPAHTANASLNYNFSAIPALKGFSAQAGMHYFGDRYAGRSTRVQVINDSYKLIYVKAFTQVDIGVGYATQTFSVRVRCSNVFDVMSYQAHDDNSINPIAPRIFSATFGWKF